jgi:DASH complex subunit DAD1
MTKEYETVAALWTSFHNLMKGVSSGNGGEDTTQVDIENAGLPGTGGARVSTSTRPQAG